MGKWTDEERGNILDHRWQDKAGIYTDDLGVRWRVKHGGYLTGLPWTPWTAEVIDATNMYGLPAAKVLYTEKERADVQSKIDAAAYAWRVSKGDLKLKPAGFGAAVLFFGLVLLFGKRKGR